MYTDINNNGNFDAGIDSGINYQYNDNGDYTQIDANTDYVFAYDARGNRTAVGVTNGSTSANLVTYEYSAAGVLTKKSYANGWYERYTYDSHGNVTAVYRNASANATTDSKAYEWKYSSENLLVRYDDLVYGTYCLYEYDDAGELLRSSQYKTSDDTQMLVIEYIRKNGEVNSLRYILGTTQLDEIEYSYNDDGELTGFSSVLGEVSLAYDALGRLTEKTLEISSTAALTEEYTYKSVTIDGIVSQSEYIAAMRLADGTVFGYTYDANGNITAIAENGTLKLSYEYDALNQLTRENNAYANKSYAFTYDNYGNILSKSEYAYTTGTLGTATATNTYGYVNDLWKDQLTSYNGNTITYDALGNPTSYYNGKPYSMTWKNGRELATVFTTSGLTSYQYNVNGVRVQKTVAGVTHNYVVDGYKILSETYGTNTLLFSYDESDTVAGMKYNSTQYYFGKNTQGDIIRIYNSTGMAVAEYTYDAWGNIVAISGTLASTIGTINPFRYRGYYFDTETDLYYLNSRYYDAKIGRFINADIQINNSILGCNLYSYCENQCISRADNKGTDAIWITQKSAAKGFGHTSLLFQDKRGIWYYFYWGPMNESFGLHVFCSKAYTELTRISPYYINTKRKTLNLYLFNLDITNNSIVGRPKINNIDKGYSNYIYIAGDFSGAINYYYQKLYTASRRPYYSLLHVNCAYMSALLLSMGNISNLRKSLLLIDMELGVKIPNLMKYSVSTIFLSSIKGQMNIFIETQNYYVAILNYIIKLCKL